MAKRHAWIGVAGKDYVFVGVKGKISQLSYGKKICLRGRNQGDWLIYDSPRIDAKPDQGGQSFIAIGNLASDEVYQVERSEGSFPNCLEVDFERCEEASILPLIESFSMNENRKSWQYPFRSGHLEISEEDFELLAEEMRLDVDSIKH